MLKVIYSGLMYSIATRCTKLLRYGNS